MGEHRPSEQTGRWVVLAAVLASSMAFIDGTALNVALPALQAALGTTGADLLWVVNAYNLFLAALLLVGGALGDRFGRKRIFMLGIAVFAGASLACGLAPGTHTLIAARAVQGLGGALMIPGSLALISTFFNPDRRGRAVGTWSAWSVIITAFGPILGGFLATAGLWRGVFFINLPLALLALAVLVFFVPENRNESRTARLDCGGPAAAIIGLACINYGLIEAPALGLLQWRVLAALGTGLVALLMFLLAETRSASPLLPLYLFKSRTFSGANLLTLCLYTAFHGVLFFLPLNLIQVQDYDAVQAALSQLPVMLLLIVLSRWAGTMVDHYGPRLPLTIGPALAGLGFLLLAVPGVTRGPAGFWKDYLPALTLLGLGMALTAAPLSTTVIGAVPAERTGLASGINSTASRLAAVLAIALLGSIGLVAFKGFLECRTRDLDLSREARATLIGEAANLGNARVPEDVDLSIRAAAHDSLRLAFVDTFRLIAVAAAALAWLGAAVAAWSFRTPRSPACAGRG